MGKCQEAGTAPLTEELALLVALADAAADSVLAEATGCAELTLGVEAGGLLVEGVVGEGTAVAVDVGEEEAGVAVVKLEVAGDVLTREGEGVGVPIAVRVVYEKVGVPVVEGVAVGGGDEGVGVPVAVGGVGEEAVGG